MDINQNHESPIQTSLMDSKTNPLYKGLEERTIKRLIRLKIPEAAFMSVRDLLDLPNYELKWYVEQVSVESRNNGKEIDKKLAKQLNAAAK